MRVLAIVSSARKKGNTAQVVDLIGEQLQAEATQIGQPCEIETVHLAQLNIGVCRGCRVCFNAGEGHCPLDDDVLPLKEKMLATDVWIVASPIYVEDVNGIMKNWIDRLAFVCHRPEFAGKYVYFVTTSGGTASGHAASTLALAFRTWGTTQIGHSGFVMGAYQRHGEVVAAHGQRAQNAARRIARAVRQGRAQRPGFLSLMTFRIQQLYWIRNAEPGLDLDYWRGQGWLDPRREFYVPIRTPPLTVWLARRAGDVLGVFFT